MDLVATSANRSVSNSGGAIMEVTRDRLLLMRW